MTNGRTFTQTAKALRSMSGTTRTDDLRGPACALFAAFDGRPVTAGLLLRFGLS